ncbi:hypothetical protein CSA37_10600 [Candidatus Fermentibacteria bacterium]|nr:MAG: hypothetical protein CSA37_10600 [Candidatus Fermentibacteria bacterium]
MNSFTYRIFDSVSAVVSAARFVERNGFACKIVPIPREFSSSCGVCLRTVSGNEDSVQKILSLSGLREKAVHTKPEE